MQLIRCLFFFFCFPSQKLALRESNISRYNAEFVEICTIGSGQFGSVHKCVNRLGKTEVSLLPTMIRYLKVQVFQQAPREILQMHMNILAIK